MYSRRNFITQSALSAMGLVVTNKWLIKKKPVIGVQLYTLKSEMADIANVAKQIALIGYTDVEVYGYTDGLFFGKTPVEFKKYFTENGLSNSSGHYYLPDFLFKGDDDVWKKAIEAAQVMQHEYMLIPWIDKQYRGDAASYKRLAGRLNDAGQMCKNAGIQLAYHNHDFEFADLGNGITAMEIIAKETSADLVKLEMDWYWVSYAGKKPLELIQQYAKRIHLWHVKDLRKADRVSTEVGNGQIDFKKIFDAKKASGMKYFYVEQEHFDGSPFDSIRKSYNYISKL